MEHPRGSDGINECHKGARHKHGVMGDDGGQVVVAGRQRADGGSVVNFFFFFFFFFFGEASRVRAREQEHSKDLGSGAIIWKGLGRMF